MIRLYKERNYSRRIFVAAMLMCSGFLHILTKLGNKQSTYKVSWECVPKSCTGRKRNIDEFWSQHLDKTAYELNALFREMGWLLRDASELCPNSKNAILTKEYKSKVYETLYNKTWGFLSGGLFKESENLTHMPTDKHLF